ncbi:TrmO family methyltransferase [Nocardia sp. NPDC004168]|uniref:TrmO family methyltransferase domain-containing protein n=1 Tax=unclassified Nocardia TaxID=2637762 RepID=UPI0033AB5052
MTPVAPTLPAFAPIGVVRCGAPTIDDVPSEGLPSRVVLDERYLAALDGIEPGDHLYVLAVFHLADPEVLTGSPGTRHAQGAFSIRSSCRPNLLGMTLSRVLDIRGTEISFEWLDFVDNSPVLDIKRYNWRWECVPSTRRLDRRFVERQLDHRTLAAVLARPAYNFHGERCARVGQTGALAATLVQNHDLWLGNPALRVHIRADGHLVDCVQGLTGATFGNGRLGVTLSDTDEPVVEFVEPTRRLSARRTGSEWAITQYPQ